MAWDPEFINSNIDAITMTYGYMRNYEDRVRRAASMKDRNGRSALWQGGMEPKIPVGSESGVAARRVFDERGVASYLAEHAPDLLNRFAELVDEVR